MDGNWITLTEKNIETEHLCCLIRTRTRHPGVEAKRAWMKERLKEGHVFRKLDIDGCAFLEYAPLETAWVPVLGENYLYLYCFWVQGAPKGHGYGKTLMESCLADAKRQGRSGVCMLGARKQKAWLSDQSFAKKYGFAPVDTAGEYALLALSFDGTAPRFAPEAKKQAIASQDLTIYYDDQCPYIWQRVETLRQFCQAEGIPASFFHVETLEQAKHLPCVFNNWAVFYKGDFVTVNQVDGPAVKKLIQKRQKSGVVDK